MVRGPVKMLYVIRPEFSGYELESLWDDAAFRLKHWHQFKRIAIVTEAAWLRAAVTMFCPFFPSEIQLFKVSELAAAMDWIARKEKAGA